MPDSWEYPWFAAWDLAFHCGALALVDIDFAKDQVETLLRENCLHPNGQIPAYEWTFSDANPPVHAAAAIKVFRAERVQRGAGDLHFLHRVFHKLLLNYAWWINRKDGDGHNIFEGGFLGLDNISVFDRSQPLPPGFSLNVCGQGTSIHHEPVELDEPGNRAMGQQLPPREFRMDLEQLQRIPNLLRLIAESTLWDTREEANLISGHKNVLG
jgi:hypothetical protein